MSHLSALTAVQLCKALTLWSTQRQTPTFGGFGAVEDAMVMVGGGIWGQ